METPRRIFLVGPMGAGKTTVGRRLAERLGFAFVDSDRHIEERTGVDIPRIFEIEGESGFRAREAAAIDDLTRRDDTVLATGGGAILDPQNREHLHERGVVIYLTASVERQLARTRHSDRPLLRTPDPQRRLAELLAERDPLYRATAHIIQDTESDTAAAVADRLTDQLAGVQT